VSSNLIEEIMDYIQLGQVEENIDDSDAFALRSQYGSQLPQPNPQVTSYIIEITPLANSKVALFNEIWEKLDSAPILNQEVLAGKSQCARDV
jgi:hypothetical protein